MPNSLKPGIECVDRLTDGIVVRFTDGKCAFYSALLLFDMLPQASPLNEKAAWPRAVEDIIPVPFGRIFILPPGA